MFASYDTSIVVYCTEFCLAPRVLQYGDRTPSVDTKYGAHELHDPRSRRPPSLKTDSRVGPKAMKALCSFLEEGSCLEVRRVSRMSRRREVYRVLDVGRRSFSELSRNDGVGSDGVRARSW